MKASDLGFTDPDLVGESAYRAVYETVDDAIAEFDDDNPEERKEARRLAAAELANAAETAASMLTQLLHADPERLRLTSLGIASPPDVADDPSYRELHADAECWLNEAEPGTEYDYVEHCLEAQIAAARTMLDAMRAHRNAGESRREETPAC